MQRTHVILRTGLVSMAVMVGSCLASPAFACQISDAMYEVMFDKPPADAPAGDLVLEVLVVNRLAPGPGTVTVLRTVRGSPPEKHLTIARGGFTSCARLPMEGARGFMVGRIEVRDGETALRLRRGLTFGQQRGNPGRVVADLFVDQGH